MKKLLSIVFVCGFILASITLNAQIYFGEAEKAVYDGLSLVSDSLASSGNYLKMADSGFVAWKPNIPESGWYKLTIGYRAFGGSKVEYLIINDMKSPVGMGYSKVWNKFSTKVFLEQGENVIQILPDWGNIELDYLSIDTTTVFPTLKPLKNNYYLEFPRDITYKINEFGYEIQSISAGGKHLEYEMVKYPYKEDAVLVTLPASELSKLSPGNHELDFNFSGAAKLSSELSIHEKGSHSGLTIIAPYVEHGSSVIFILPTGKTMLVDCGKDWVRDSILIPTLQENNINRIDYFFLTHYHDDHDSGDRGAKIKKMFDVQNFYDYKSFTTGETFILEGVDFKILNSFNDGNDENTSSLSFKMTYNGFIYVHGGDTYAVNQEKIMEIYPDDIKADVFYANHHFHGSVDPAYIKAMDPAIVLLQAQEAIYARSAYMDDYKKNVEDFLHKNSDRYIEDLPTLEVGTVVIRVNSNKDWQYETYPDTINTIPYLSQD